MIERKQGHLVSMSSIAGAMGCENVVPYSASKFAVRGMMEALTEEMRRDSRNLDIKCTTICPFVVGKIALFNWFPFYSHHLKDFKLSFQIRAYVKDPALSNYLSLPYLREQLNLYLLHFSNRFPSFLRVTNVKDAASIIVRAVRRGDTLVFMPEYVYYFWLLIKYGSPLCFTRTAIDF